MTQEEFRRKELILKDKLSKTKNEDERNKIRLEVEHLNNIRVVENNLRAASHSKRRI